MDALRQDLRYAVRTLARSRAFTVSAVLCLALGIGINTAVFSVVNAVLLRPFGFADADRAVSLETANPRQGVEGWGLSPADFWEWKEQSRTLAEVAAMTGSSFALAGAEADAERVEGYQVTPDLFPMRGIAPTLALAGAAIGVAGALVVGRAMAGVMYGVGGADPFVLVGVPLALGGVALLACYLPARRATRIDPLLAMRSE